jgi:hypothetical protein
MLKTTRYYISVLFILIFFACTVSRKAKRKEPPVPDYSKTYFWSALPFKKDSADLVVPNSGLKDMQSAAEADVFYIHPTDNHKGMNLNADLSDTAVINLMDHLAGKYQASVFNGCCRVYMPRYRDVKVLAYFIPEPKKQEVFDIAYNDIKRAFLYYLKHYNTGRPFIIAGHSQGSDHVIRLCKEFFDRDSVLNKKLIAAYIIGGVVFKNTYKHFRPCSDSLQTNCFVTYNAVSYGILTFLGKPVKDVVCVNPLTWQMTTEQAPASLNKGGLPFSYKKIDPGVADAKIAPNGLLWVHHPKRSNRDYPWIHKPNFHRLEYNLFYMNIRYNARQRVDSWLNKHQ